MKIKKASLHNEAVTRLRDMITEGRLEPGSKVSEKDLCELFGISRTPLREALKVLATEGLIVLLPQRGARVAQFTGKDMGDLFQVMGELEGLAGELACAKITDEAVSEIRARHHEMLAHYTRGDRPAYFAANQAIHEAIIAAAENSVLTVMFESLRGRLRPARFMANVSRERWDQAVREHGEILAALTRRDGARLRALLQEHLRNKYLALVASAEKSARAGGEQPTAASAEKSARADGELPVPVAAMPR
jgi:DNA-binding GntR family transcriptional regulator